ncbi:hypothetical protein BDB00DRAFT_799490 [Zychaea mexicana]|uniref:uncharacterized protein n=1 Tax=Zychaea mexicana TaxID=64656 RepID=UPI0022FDED4E|nr:uncharacterized protein BDB00DRAFT_799490 [Zychaea mexicana]KAI9498775.1 hypothetical protein BDB00DRAFT_799490 [Zychaea mexicana]
MMADFNTEPIMLRHDSSLAAADDKMMLYQQQPTCFPEEDRGDLMMDVPQNLGPEQVTYEFPPKARLQALAQIYDNDPADDCSFFDESSFTTTSTFTNDLRSTSACSSRHSYATLSPPVDYANDHLDRFFDSVLDQVVSCNNPMERQHQEQQMHCDTNSDEDDDDSYLVDDGRLSPLELPEQEEQVRRDREQSCDSTATVKQQVVAAPCSFLGSVREEQPRPHSHNQWPEHHHNHRQGLYRGGFQKNNSRPSAVNSEDLPVFCSESELLRRPTTYSSSSSCAAASDMTNESHIVVIRLSKKTKVSTPIIDRCPSSQTTWSSDEGYDDNDDVDGCSNKELPIESASIFLPLSDQEQEHLIHNDILRSAAAVRIQAAWRGYRFRRRQQQQQFKIKPKHRLMVDVVRLCGQVHRQQMNRVQTRLHDVEDDLREETAMRIAFEKAMEDMTVLVDQQQKVLYDRLEQEINMRQVYERKMEQALLQVEPLERNIRKEAKARNELQGMMTRVLEQMHDMKREQKAETEARKKLEQQLSEAHAEIEKLKQRPTATAIRVKPAAATTGQQPRTGLTVHAGARSVSSMATSVPSSKSTVLRRNNAAQRPTSRASSRMSSRTDTTTTTTTRTTTTTATAGTAANKRLIPRTTTPVSRKR